MTTPSERDFPGDAATPALARGFAASVLDRLLPPSVARALIGDLELVVSELVTNAVRAGSAVITVSVAHNEDRIAVQVRDGAPGWPEVRAAGIRDVGGRGLALVSAICSSWGVRLGSGGKTVWAELAVPGPAGSAHS